MGFLVQEDVLRIPSSKRVSGTCDEQVKCPCDEWVKLYVMSGLRVCDEWVKERKSCM